MNKPHLLILGVRGIPAAHGGFETFAQWLSLMLSDHDWDVTVYCQERGVGRLYESTWKGVRRVHIPVPGSGPMSAVLFDLLCVLDAQRRPGSVLTLGYNTAVFGLLHRLFKRFQIINMDGLEWRRAKWSWPVKRWFKVNEWLACRSANLIIADNPSIAEHLAAKVSPQKIVTIPYSARRIHQASTQALEEWQLTPGDYAILIARPEPENSILELVSAFSQRERGLTLVVLGCYRPDGNRYHRKVLARASAEVKFIGTVYDEQRIDSLRYHARFYLHGHQVGGTNPSLVEALGSGTPVIAYDNPFNRWVAADAAIYFNDASVAAEAIDSLSSNDGLRASLQQAAGQQYARLFNENRIEQLYIDLFASTQNQK